MPSPVTELLSDHAKGLDTLPPQAIARILAESQSVAAASVSAAAEPIGAAAAAMAQSIRSGGRLFYVAAGSSGLMAASDALELGGTFAIPPRQVRILMAGGMPTGSEMPGAVEDDTDALATALADLGSDDTMITVSASGTTPYTLAAARIAREKGATLVGIANNAGAPLLLMADHAIHLATPPEAIAGSTRLGAGTAQKIALNTMSTLMAVHLGHIHDGMMVNVVADNEKLRGRARQMVMSIAGVGTEAAETALAATGGRVKIAVLVAARGLTPGRAAQLLAENNDNLRAVLALG